MAAPTDASSAKDDKTCKLTDAISPSVPTTNLTLDTGIVSSVRRRVKFVKQHRSLLDKISKFSHSKAVAIPLYIILSLFISLLIVLCILYGFAQLYSISFSNFWCDKSYTIDEIYTINKKNGYGEGDPLDTCLQTDIIVDYNKLFDNDPSETYGSKFQPNSQNVAFCVFYQIITIIFTYILLKNVVPMLIDSCKKLNQQIDKHCDCKCTKQIIEILKCEKCRDHLSMPKQSKLQMPSKTGTKSTTTPNPEHNMSHDQGNINNNGYATDTETVDDGRRDIRMDNLEFKSDKQQEFEKKLTNHKVGDKKNRQGKNTEEIGTDHNKNHPQNAFLQQCSKLHSFLCGKLAFVCIKWLSVDTGPWILLKLFSESLEIFLQILVLFQYGGTSLSHIFSNSSNGSERYSAPYLAQLPGYVIAFAIIILLNGIITGTFWCLYGLFPHLIYGHSFNYGLFVIDGIFDSLYCIFPIIIISGGNSSIISFETILNKIGILQHSNWINFFGTFFPIALLIRKADASLIRMERIIKGKKIGDEYAVTTSDMIAIKNNVIFSPSTAAVSAPANDIHKLPTIQERMSNVPHISEYYQNHDEQQHEQAIVAVNKTPADSPTPGTPKSVDSEESAHSPFSPTSFTVNTSTGYASAYASAAMSSPVDTSTHKTGNKTIKPLDLNIEAQAQMNANDQDIKIVDQPDKENGETNSDNNYKAVGNQGKISKKRKKRSFKMRSSIKMPALSHGLKHVITTQEGTKIEKKLFISHRSLFERRLSQEFAQKTIRQRKKIEHSKRVLSNSLKRMFIVFVGLFIMCGIPSFITISAIIDIYQSHEYCTQYDDYSYRNSSDLVEENQELILYNQGCQTQVYQLFSDYPCNCRFFQFTATESLDYNSSICQIAESGMYDIGELISNIFIKWTMLERIWFESAGNSACFERFNLYINNSQFFNTKNLQVLKLSYVDFVFNGNIVNDDDIIDDTNSLIETSMKNWENLIFLDMLHPSFVNGYLNTVLTAIGVNMRDMIYLTIEKLDDVTQFPDTFCNLKNSLKYLSFSIHGMNNSININSCMQDFIYLEYFKLYIGLNSDLSLQKLFNLPNIKIIALNDLSISWDFMVDQFYNTTSTNDDSESELFVGYNNESINEIYLQLTDVCRDYDIYISNSSLSESIEHDELISMIKQYGACDSVCSTQALELFCLPFEHHNGVCDEHCFLADCGWDGGDCNQLCDFDNCELAGWTNGYCDIACNSSECHWDGYDCGTDGLVCPANCSATWINDGYCMTLCLEPDDDSNNNSNSSNSIYQECYDMEKESDCTECSEEGSYSCSFMYSVFETAILTSNEITVEEQSNLKIDVISSENWCNLDAYWALLQSTLGVDNLNCNNITMNPKYDLNMNNVTGLFEFYYMFVNVLEDDLGDYIIRAIDCSFCLYNKSNYYL